MTISDLEQQLTDAQEHLRLTQQGFNIKTLSEAIDSVATAQRALAAAKGEEYAIPYDTQYHPDAAVSEPVILQTDHTVILTFSALQKMPDGYFHDAGYAIVEFDRCCLSKFGLPNDEAWAGHPLYSKGLNGYGIYEVINSSWIEDTLQSNHVAFPHGSDWIADKRHFLFAFHDNMFECLAQGMQLTVSTEPYEQIFAEIVRRIFK